ncbi:gamma-butyrobetaine dioxygenase [Lampetra fluviatilis]
MSRFRVRRRDDEGTLEVRWRGGARRRYPYVWLRDNCLCPGCFLPSAQARRSLMAQLDPGTGVAEVAVTSSGQGVSVLWPDGHRSDFSGRWLAARCFSAASRAATQEAIFMEERELWGCEMSARLPAFPFEAVLSDGAASLAWLTSLRRHGLALLHGAPARRGQIERLANSVGFLRLTFYGNVWEVRDKSDANNVAYTAGPLAPHTDYPALTHPPGVQFLHCVRQAVRGGASQLVDGFAVCEQLRREQPEAFRLLASTPLNYVDVGTDLCDFHVHSRNPVIQLDEQGRVQRINLNHATRDSVLDVPLRAVRPLYAALSRFSALTESPRNQITFTLRPGDVITFDNWRLLHGRADYVDLRSEQEAGAGNTDGTGNTGNTGDSGDAGNTGDSGNTGDTGDSGDTGRLLEGCYLDWEVVLSRLRLLRAGLEKETRRSASAGRLPSEGGPAGTLG